MVTRRSAKPPFEGSNPSRASIFLDGFSGLLQVLVLSQAFDPTQTTESILDALRLVDDVSDPVSPLPGSGASRP